MTVSLADSTDLRIILSILYIITEVIWAEKQNANSEYKDQVESFTSELSKHSTFGDLVGTFSECAEIVFFSRFTHSWWAVDGEIVRNDNAIL